MFHTNSYKALIPKADRSSSDCGISKKIPHFAWFWCQKMLQSEESDLNTKTKLSFLRLLVIKEIPHFVGFHSSLILQPEKYELKVLLPQIEGYRNSSLCRFSTDNILQTDWKAFQLKYRIVFYQYLLGIGTKSWIQFHKL